MATVTFGPIGLFNYRLNDSIEFIIDMPDIGDGETIEKRFGYQLLCADGTEVTKPKNYQPKQAGTFRIRFDREIRRHLKTPIPDPNGGSTQSGEGLKKEFKLKYWEIHIDKENCEDGPQEVGVAETTTFTVVNTVVQTWANYFPTGTNTPTAPNVLHNKPTCIPICEDGTDYVYICESQFNPGITAGQSLVFTDGTTQNISQTPMPDGINAIGPAVSFPNGIPIVAGKTVKGMRVVLRTNIGGIISDIYYSFKCCKDQAVLYFKESAGGYSGMFFCEILNGGMNVQGTEVCTYTEFLPLGGTSIQDYRRQNGGNRVINKTGREQVTFRMEIPEESKQWRRWINDFAMSESYYMLDCDNLGNNYLVKFIANGGIYQSRNSQTNNLDLIVTGKIEQNYYLPSY